MKRAWESLLSALGAGLLVVIPLYLAILLLLKAMGSVMGLVEPIAKLLPEWFPGEYIFALLLILLVSIVVGFAVRTAVGGAFSERIRRSLFERIPGYGLLRSLTQQLAGFGEETAWQPALAEIEEALVPAFIIEELADGRYTVFVPSVPTPLAGAVYVLARERVHPLDVPFTHAVKSVTRWGHGASDLVAAMKAPDR